MRPRALVFCGAGRQAGLGHLMRSLAFARALAGDFRFTFCLGAAGPGVASLVRRAGFARIGPAQARRWMESRRPGLVVNDTYGRPDSELAAWRRRGCFVVDFDDAGRTSSPAHLVYSPYRPEKKARRRSAGPVVVSGLRYLALDPAAAAFRPKASRRAAAPGRALRSVLVSFGGSDTFNLTKTALDWLARSGAARGLNVTVVLGPHYRHPADFRAWSRRAGAAVRTVRNRFSLWPLLSAAELAFVSGGRIKYELAAVGVPSVTVAASPIEDRYSRAFARTGSALHLGLHPVDPRRAVARIRALAGRPGRLAAMRRSALRAVDGRGAERLRRIVLQHYRRFHEGRR